MANKTNLENEFIKRIWKCKFSSPFKDLNTGSQMHSVHWNTSYEGKQAETV